MLAAAWVAVGPLGLVALAGVALLPRWRHRWRALRPDRPWRAAGGALLALVVLGGGLVLLPERWVPHLPGPGLLATSAYDGRPAVEQPLPTHRAGPTPPLAGRPDLPADRSGPVGDLPHPEATALGWPGHGCAPVAHDLRPPVLLCAAAPGADTGSELLLLDPEGDGAPEVVDRLRLAAGGCTPVAAPVTDPDRPDALVVTDGSRLLEVRAEGDRLVGGEPVQVDGAAPDDCAVEAAAPGEVWVRTAAGRLLRLDGRRSRAAAPPGGAPAGGGLLVDGSTAWVAHGGGVVAVDRVTVERRWQRDLGGTTSAPALVDGRWLVLGLDRGPRAEVVALDARTGEEACRAEVFEDGAGRVADRPVALPGAVLLRNGHGGADDGDGLALLRLPGCEVAWTAGDPAVAPLAVARRTGLAYAVQRAWTPALVPVTRLAAVDPWTGRQSFAARAATGLLGAPTGAAPALGPGGAAYVVVRGGLVRVADR